MAKKILVIDDEPELVTAVKIRLEASRYEVGVAYDGQAGVDKAKEVKPDLILLDIIMPKMGGKELYLKLLEINPDIKFIFTSGYASRGFYKKYELDQDMTIINKPFRLKEVSQIVDQALRGS